jgi:predicted branched-subunit amino acid permease
MRHIYTHTHFRAGFGQMLPACVGLIPFGLVTGVGAAAAGAGFWGALGMSMIIFSGAAQILAAQLLAANAPLAVVILTCFLAGLRFLMYSAAMAPYLKALPERWRNTLPFLLTDQVFASVIRRIDTAEDPHAGAMHFLGSGIALWTCWQVTNVTGFLLGNLIPPSWSLEFAVPLCFIALIAPLLRSVPVIVAAVVGGVAVLALASLPMKINLVVAGVAGIVAGTLVDLAKDRWSAR